MKQDGTIVISANGKGATWNYSTGFIGDPILVDQARTAARWGMVVVLHPLAEPVSANDLTPLGAYAALAWAAGGREVLVESAPEIDAYFESVPRETISEWDDICPDGQIETRPTMVERA